MSNPIEISPNPFGLTIESLDERVQGPVEYVARYRKQPLDPSCPASEILECETNFDQEGFTTNRRIYDEEGKLSKQAAFEYDERKRLLQIYVTDAAGQTIRTSKFRYITEHSVEETTSDRLGLITGKTVTAYESAGDVREVVKIDSEGNRIQANYRDEDGVTSAKIDGFEFTQIQKSADEVVHEVKVGDSSSSLPHNLRLMETIQSRDQYGNWLVKTLRILSTGQNVTWKRKIIYNDEL